MKIKIFLSCICIFIGIILISSVNGLTQEKQNEPKNKKITNEEIAPKEEKEEIKLAEKPGSETDFEFPGGLDADSETGVDTGEFVYRPNGRRDPFWDLLMGKSSKIKKEAKEGIEGLEIEQLELEGIVNRSSKYIALFKGPDGKPYDVQVGQSVYDGEIIEINANSVVFKKILTIALGGTKEKTIVKWLNPEKEKEQ
jgi:uncharacterized membrane protein YkoI